MIGFDVGSQLRQRFGAESYSLSSATGCYMEDRRHIFNRPITLLGFMISAKNQNPLSRSGLKNESRKSQRMAFGL